MVQISPFQRQTKNSSECKKTKGHRNIYIRGLLQWYHETTEVVNGKSIGLPSAGQVYISEL